MRIRGAEARASRTGARAPGVGVREPPCRGRAAVDVVGRHPDLGGAAAGPRQKRQVGTERVRRLARDATAIRRTASALNSGVNENVSCVSPWVTPLAPSTLPGMSTKPGELQCDSGFAPAPTRVSCALESSEPMTIPSQISCKRGPWFTGRLHAKKRAMLAGANLLAGVFAGLFIARDRESLRGLLDTTRRHQTEFRARPNFSEDRPAAGRAEGTARTCPGH